MRSQDVGEICVSQVTPGVVGREGRYQLLRISESERDQCSETVASQHT